MLITGLLLGAALLIFMTWDGLSHSNRPAKASSHVVEIAEADWQTEVIDSELPVVVDFTAPWCGPCQQFAPTLDRLAEQYKGKVKVAKVDFDQAKKLKAEYNITGIPCIMLFKRGRLVERWLGAPPGREAELVRAIDSVL
jgi:thioredoxin 1